ncbi:MAG: phage protease [Puniceicoccales bacterium]|jgi:hypothetical protein|nr:phage protease [Puniceicoccales bacterium]
MDTALQEINWSSSPYAETSATKRWMKLIAYGEYPHPNGLQCIDRSIAQAMVEHFKSFRGRLRRKFGGLPLYIGHPDDPQFRSQAGHQDTRAYAWIQDMDARDDGLWIFIKWSDIGLQLIHNAFFKFFSPRWEMQIMASGKYKPIRLLSVGLTNHPNIPGDAIANQEITIATASLNITTSSDLENFLSDSIREGHILPNECPEWDRRYGEDPERAREEIQNHHHGLHLQAHSAAIHESNPQVFSRERMRAQVHQRMQAGETYADAWASVRQSHPQFF